MEDERSIIANKLTICADMSAKVKLLKEDWKKRSIQTGNFTSIKLGIKSEVGTGNISKCHHCYDKILMSCCVFSA
ncbi:Hypothetical predicted protein [Octopus vulgaris]|uniref:Uncharacterized protein n=1 Tax=Octopus vulgaris TaxID=6645 RepID=A0AA36EWT7_OCTVU|nr:Hypothetical predicted protein [Octopus vulgaris]